MSETSTQSGGRPSLPMAGVPQPTRDEVLNLPRVHFSSHPVMAHKMTALRDKNTQPPEFYRLVKEIGALRHFGKLFPISRSGTLVYDAMSIPCRRWSIIINCRTRLICKWRML